MSLAIAADLYPAPAQGTGQCIKHPMALVTGSDACGGSFQSAISGILVWV